MKDIIGNIKKLEKLFPEKWLLVEVIKEDALGNSVEGRLIKHSKSKEKVIERAKEIKQDLALFYPGKIPKKGYAFCFEEENKPFLLMKSSIIPKV